MMVGHAQCQTQLRPPPRLPLQSKPGSTFPPAPGARPARTRAGGWGAALSGLQVPGLDEETERFTQVGDRWPGYHGCGENVPEFTPMWPLRFAG